MRSAATLLTSLLILSPLRAESPVPRWDNTAVLGAGLSPFRYQVDPILPPGAITNPVHTQAYTTADGTRRLLIASSRGAIYTVPAEGELEAAPVANFDLSEHLASELGLLAKQLAFRLFSTLFEQDLTAHPHLYFFANNRRPAPARNLILRFEIKTLDPLTLGTATEIITWESSGHDGGDMAWGPDGMLYITAGDRSAPGDPNNWGQRTDDIFGSVLRIDVRGGTPYAVPPDNPFVGKANVRPEIWAYGLRNPWRFSFHPDNDELWVGDNGDESWELVHRIEKGANAGWSAFEGNAIFRSANKLAGPTLVHTPAIVQHPHSEMRSVIGGIFYRGTALPALRDHYLYGCYFTKRLWAFPYRDGHTGTPFLIADAGGQIVAITEDHDYEPVITCHDGKVFRLIANPAPPSPRPWPDKLSATNLFADTAGLTPAPGVYSYLTNAKSWSDGAEREHVVAIAGKADSQMTPTTGAEAGRSWNIPAGSIIGQTLTLRGKKAETQLLHFDGTWRGYTYQWNPAGTDATLIPDGGLDTTIGGQQWRFMSRAECMSCHTHRSNFSLTLCSAQLERPGPDGATNQIDHFIALGLLKRTPNLIAERGKPTPDPYDETVDLDTRARSYLDLNCAHCHRETGLGGRAGFQLLAKLPLEETGILNAKPLVGLSGNPNAQILAPGHPELSELLTRTSRRGAGQMPLIGSHRVDDEGVAILRAWIQAMISPR